MNNLPNNLTVEKIKAAKLYFEAHENREAGRYVGKCVCGRAITGAMFRQNECPACQRPLIR